ncbi:MULTISPECIES: hypothetical protein [unclassified Janthinobacterium]|uniref:hypothetical protein n=1 Tax=unclassified Janthinobacterium TaxID=2610881 RepID=UPI0017AB4F8A|nr:MULTISPECIES: hypothetical protein [unclassified Janthinobacterium]MBB5610380.1 hypothetical protein [Janthinobacterium sp. S3T4]MBB5615783.1 hypothetical protein [Janthinobacterium sp. S3M3]
MNEVIEMPRRESAGLVAAEVHRYSLVEIRERVNLVQEVMRGIMKKDTHYGTIPSTPKPTLYKPGAEVLCVTFRIAPIYRILDLSTDLVARFRVTCIGQHQVSDIMLGEGVGECSSAEEKYKWRAAVCAEEFNLTPEIMRRLKFYKNGGKATQVRTEAADLSNTVLKMACKRAMIAMTLNVTAASDIFTQDIEDLPEELRSQDAGEPALSALAIEWVAKANAAPTAEDLALVWKAGVKAINEAKDATASNAFKTAVTARGETLKAAQPAAKPAAQPLSAAAAEILADMEVVADDGVEVFAASWGSLSKSTQNTLAPHYDALMARAQKARGAA